MDNCHPMVLVKTVKTLWGPVLALCLCCSVASAEVPATADTPAQPSVLEQVLYQQLQQLEREVDLLRAWKDGLVQVWLGAMAAFLSLLAIVFPIIGFIGYRRFVEIEQRAADSEQRATSLFESYMARARVATEAIEEIRLLTAGSAKEELPPQTSAETEIDRAIRAAIVCERQGEYPRAVELWSGVATLAEDTGVQMRALYSVGYLQQLQGLDEEAVQSYMLAEALDTNLVERDLERRAKAWFRLVRQRIAASRR